MPAKSVSNLCGEEGSENQNQSASNESMVSNVIGRGNGIQRFANLDSEEKKIAYANLTRKMRLMHRLHTQTLQIEASFYREVDRIRCKYSKLYAPILEKRKQIICGTYTPNDTECDLSQDYEEKCIESNLRPLPRQGIPGFWLSVLKKVYVTSEMIQNHDEDILMHLNDISVGKDEDKPLSFTLNFHFEPNEYFENSVLTKDYNMTCEIDEKKPFLFDGPQISSCKGCVIRWKDGKNVTEEENEIVDSFFNFFDPTTSVLNESMDSEDREFLAADFEIGQFISGRLVSRAVLFYTGEAIDIEQLDETRAISP